MKIQMKETTKVSTTGTNVLIWEEGETYDAPKDLAKNLVTSKLAVLVKEKAAAPDPAETPEKPEK